MTPQPHLPDDVAVAFVPNRAIDQLRGRARRRQVHEDADRVVQPLVMEHRHLAIELDHDPDGIWEYDAANIPDRDDAR